MTLSGTLKMTRMNGVLPFHPLHSWRSKESQGKTS
jgi:hypothetical protein